MAESATKGYIAYTKCQGWQLNSAVEAKTLIHPKEEIHLGKLHLYPDGVFVIDKWYTFEPSIPILRKIRWLLPHSVMQGACVHDGLYELLRKRRLDPFYKELADQELKRYCISDGMWKWQAYLVYLGVKYFGEPSTKPSAIQRVYRSP